jgi:hypothetical protein
MLIDGKLSFAVIYIPGGMFIIIDRMLAQRGINYHWKSSANLIFALETSLTNISNSAAAHRLRFFEIVFRQA